MNLKWYYWYFQGVIPPRICDDIVRYGKKQQKQKIKNAVKKHMAKSKTKGNAQRSKMVIAWGQLPRNPC